MYKMLILICLIVQFHIAFGNAKNAFVEIVGDGVVRASDKIFHVAPPEDGVKQLTITPRKGWCLQNGGSGEKIVISFSGREQHSLIVKSVLHEDWVEIIVEPCYYEYDQTEYHVEDPEFEIMLNELKDKYAYLKDEDMHNSVSLSFSPEINMIKGGKHRIEKNWYPCSCGAIHTPQHETQTVDVVDFDYTWLCECGDYSTRRNILAGEFSGGSYHFSATVNAFSRSCCQAELSTNFDFVVYEVQTTAEKLWPGRADRRKLGVAEVVTVTTHPSVEFTLSGDFDTSELGDNSIQAPDVVADCNKQEVVTLAPDLEVTIPFFVVVPNDVVYQGDGVEPLSKNSGIIYAGMSVPLKILANDISFENLYFKEESASPEDVWGCFRGHENSADYMSHAASVNPWECGDQNCLSENDKAEIFMGAVVDWSWGAGGFSWRIPWQWYTGHGVSNPKTIKTILQKFEIQNDKTAKVSKFGLTASRRCDETASVISQGGN